MLNSFQGLIIVTELGMLNFLQRIENAHVVYHYVH